MAARQTKRKFTMTDIYDPLFVKGIFDRCSDRYIWFSYACSFGFTERWRRQCASLLNLDSNSPAVGYDLMAGTGEVWPHLLKRFPNIQKITAVDISTGMHEKALKRLHRTRESKVSFAEDDVLNSNLPPQSADFIISTFGLKTFNAEQHTILASLIARSLKPGGVFSLIEASDPKGWRMRPLYNFYLKRILPIIESFFLRGALDFTMINKYTTNFGDASGVANALRTAGLEVRFKSHFFGTATSESGRKPSNS